MTKTARLSPTSTSPGGGGDVKHIGYTIAVKEKDGQITYYDFTTHTDPEKAREAFLGRSGESGGYNAYFLKNNIGRMVKIYIDPQEEQ